MQPVSSGRPGAGFALVGLAFCRSRLLPAGRAAEHRLWSLQGVLLCLLFLLHPRPAEEVLDLRMFLWMCYAFSLSFFREIPGTLWRH